MASLSGATIATTFKSLLKLAGNTDDLVAGASGAGKQVMTGDGESTPIYLNTDRVGIGTASPDTILHVMKGDASVNPYAPSSIILETAGTTGDAAAGYINFLSAANNASGHGLVWTDVSGETQGYLYYQHSTDSLVIGGDDNPNVGIGTAAPVDNVHIAGVNGSDCSLVITSYASSPATSAPNIKLYRARSTQEDAIAGSSNCIVADNDVLGAVYFGGFIDNSGDDYTNYEAGAAIIARVQGAATNADNDLPTELTFLTNPDGATDMAQRMTILANGNVGIGEVSPTAKLMVTETEANTYAVKIKHTNAEPQGIYIEHSGKDSTGDDTTDDQFLACNDSNSNNFIIYGDGDVVTAEGSLASDRRIKTDIVDATSKLDDINKLKVINFKFTGTSRKRLGFIADEFETVFPSLIKERKIKKYGVEYDDLKTITQTVLIPILVKAVQELSAKVTALEGEDSSSDTKIAALEAKDTEYATTIAALTARITALESA